MKKLVLYVVLLFPFFVLSQTFREWTGTGNNWSTASNWNPSGITYAQLEWKGLGLTTSNNDAGNPYSAWRLFFTGSQAYTITGNPVSLFDFSSNNSWVLSQSSVGQVINNRVNFYDGGTRTSWITTQNSGSLTFGGLIDIGGGVTALRIAGSNTSGTITFNNTISGSGKPIDIGINELGNVQTNTRVFFNGTNTYTGPTTIFGGTLSVQDNAALGTAGLNIGNGSNTSTFAVTGTTTRTQNINILDNSSAGVINVASGQTFTLSGNLVGGANNGTKYGKDGSGTFVVSGTSNTYNGQIQIGNGIVRVQSSLGTNNTTSNRGIDLGLNVGDVSTSNNVSLQAIGGVTVNQSIYIAPNTSGASRTISLSGSGSCTFSNEIFLGGDVTFNGGSGTLNLTGNIISTGGVIVDGGTVVLSANANTYSGTTTVTGGTLRVIKNSHQADITSSSIAFTFASPNQAAGTYNFLPGQLIGTGRTLTSNLVSTKSISFNYTTGSVIICDLITPTFNSVAPICAGGSLSPLPTTSTNGITGTWSPALNNATTTTYTFTPNAGQCATTTTLTITVNAPAASAGTNGTLTVCQGTIPTNTQLFAALGGSPALGGTWSNVGLVYTYTQTGTAPCPNNTATVTVTEQAPAASAGTNGTLTVCQGTIPTNTQLFAALGGSPAPGGTWSNVGLVYTYTQTGTAPCPNNTATVTVTESAQPVWYRDADADGFGNPAVTTTACTNPSVPGTLWVSNNTDCNDSNTSVNPSATEICYNGIDDNCNSTVNEGCPVPTVNMTATTATLPTFSTAVAANPYSLAPYTNLKYRFIITKIQTGQANEVQELTLPTRFVTIPQAMRSYTATYTVRAAAVINDEILAYLGNTMTVNPPSIDPITLSPTSCGATLSNLNASISANPGLNATGYIFRIRRASETSPLTGPFFTSSSPTRFINANTFSGLPLEYSSAYKVSVAYTYLDPSNNSTQTTAYGAECDLFTLTIPTINLVAPTCGTLLAPAPVSSMTATVAAAPASGATGYQFRIRQTGGSTYFTTGILPSRFTQLSLFGTTLAFSTNYSISVQYYSVINGVTTPSGYGSECHITTPAHPTTRLVQTQCGNSYTLTQQLNIVAYPGFPKYRVRLTQPDPLNPEEALVIATREVDYSYFKMGDFPEAQVGETYSVDVAIRIYGVFGDYDTQCEITVAPAARTVAVVPFKATAYPNPFAENFMLDVKTESTSLVNVKVYDMVGRLIEQRDVRTSDLETTTIGDNYPSGVYNIVVAQEGNLETVRVVKR